MIQESPILHTLIGRENREGGLLLCGINHGYSKEDERKDTADTSEPDSQKSFFSDSEVNNCLFRNRIISWFDLWGYNLAKSKDNAGIFERSIVQTNWLPTCSNNTRGINIRQACIKDNEQFFMTCEALKPRVIFLFSKELLLAFISPSLSTRVKSTFGARKDEVRWDKKNIFFNGKPRRRFLFGFQQYENLTVVSLPHPTGAKGIADDYIEAFKPEISKIIDIWWDNHKEKLTNYSG